MPLSNVPLKNHIKKITDNYNSGGDDAEKRENQSWL
jgi:hypothetical protein